MAEEKIEETKEKFIPIKVPVFKEVELKFLPWGGCRDFNNIIAYFTTEELKTKPINKDIKDRSKKMYDDFVATINKLGPNVYKEAFGPIETMIKYWIIFCGNELCANPVSEAITMEFYRLLTKDCWDFENELVLTKQAERVTPMKLIWFGTPLIITQNYGGKSWYENFNE